MRWESGRCVREGLNGEVILINRKIILDLYFLFIKIYSAASAHTDRIQPCNLHEGTAMIPKTILRHNGLTLECFFAGNGKLQGKIEHAGGRSTGFAYQFDEAGHLASATRNGLLLEAYRYNADGQRIQTYRAGFIGNGCWSGLMIYDHQGRLAATDSAAFLYNRNGALAKQINSLGATSYAYGKGTLLDEVVIPILGRIRYEYDSIHRIVPARRFRGECLTAEYAWRDPLHLSGYLNHEHHLEYRFFHDNSGRPDRVRITPMPPTDRKRSPDSLWFADRYTRMINPVRLGRKQRLHELLDMNGGALDLLCGTDQVGTLKLLTDMNGRPVKVIERDSFGNRGSDSFSELIMPIGFAGGLEDPDTRLVHFGYRDYDPATGRFTAPDPLGDTGGDHDLYDYCVDDPVTMNDPMGLFPAALAFLGGQGLALGLGLGGAYGAATVADQIKSSRDGEKSTVARDAITTITPPLAGIVSGGAATSLSPLAVTKAVLVAPGVMASGAGAVTAAGQRVAAALQSGKYGDAIMRAGQFAEGMLNPNPSVAPPFAGAMGTITNEASKRIQRLLDERARQK